VADAMTPHPVTVEPWMSVWVAADLMVVHDVNRLPVVDLDGRLVGIVTRDDLVRAFVRSDAEIEAEIREQLLPSVGLSTTSLDVRVARGIVTIAGEPQAERVEQCLRETLHLVPGVVRVDWKVGASVGTPEPVA
jgi:CBS-domain-containing membrane protein